MANKNTAFRLPEELIENLDRIADDSGATRTEVAIQFLSEGINRTIAGDTVVQRKSALTEEEIRDAFEKLSAPIFKKIEMLESRLGK